MNWAIFARLKRQLLRAAAELNWIKRKIFSRKPHICILADFPDWAYAASARELQKHLAAEFNIEIRYVIDRPRLVARHYDLIHVCFWGESCYKGSGFKSERVIKEVSSHRWQDNPRYGPCTPDEFAQRYLADCDTVVCTSARLTKLLEHTKPRLFHTPNGIDPERFNPSGRTANPKLVFGWAGDVNDSVKGFRELVEPSCGSRRSLRAATGDLSHAEMAEFYKGLDVFVVSSIHEGEPLTLLEAMASGCFPVCTDVGIVPELIEHGRNGYIVRSRTVPAFREAFEWCENNETLVRRAGAANAEFVLRNRNWKGCASYFGNVYRDTLSRIVKKRRRG